LDRDAALARSKQSVSKSAAALRFQWEINFLYLAQLLIVTIAIIALATSRIINIEAGTFLNRRVCRACRRRSSYLKWVTTA
jgi:hypothetical protein